MSGILRFILRALAGIARWLEQLLGPVTAPAITIVRVRPGMGWPGTILTIDGIGFSDLLDGNIVSVGGDAALVVRASATQLVIAAGEHATTGAIHVTVGADTATAAEPFVILPWPELRDSASSGPPVFFHGPQEGTPAVGKQDQPVLVIFTQGLGDPPVDIAAEISTEMASFKDAERFWFCPEGAVHSGRANRCRRVQCAQRRSRHCSAHCFWTAARAAAGDRVPGPAC